MKKIIKGYKGILDLDLSQINPVFHNELIKQHYNDIESYKDYQKSLPDEMKYENTIEKIIKNKIYCDSIRDEKIYNARKKENERLQNLLEVYYKIGDHNAYIR